MFGDISKMFTAGGKAIYKDEEWILISDTLMRTHDDKFLYTAVRGESTFPAGVCLIPIDPQDILPRFP